MRDAWKGIALLGVWGAVVASCMTVGGLGIMVWVFAFFATLIICDS